VSCFGDSSSGDLGDNWKVVVDSEWKRGTTVKFQYVDTGRWLSSNKQKFPNPINGQQEVCAIDKATSKDTEWTAEEGFFFPKGKVGAI